MKWRIVPFVALVVVFVLAFGAMTVAAADPVLTKYDMFGQPIQNDDVWSKDFGKVLTGTIPVSASVYVNPGDKFFDFGGAWYSVEEYKNAMKKATAVNSGELRARQEVSNTLGIPLGVLTVEELSNWGRYGLPIKNDRVDPWLVYLGNSKKTWADFSIPFPLAPTAPVVAPALSAAAPVAPVSAPAKAVPAAPVAPAVSSNWPTKVEEIPAFVGLPANWKEIYPNLQVVMITGDCPGTFSVNWPDGKYFEPFVAKNPTNCVQHGQIANGATGIPAGYSGGLMGLTYRPCACYGK